MSRVADPDLFGRIRKIFTRSGSYRYFGYVKFFVYFTNRAFTHFQVNFQYFQIKIIIIQISEEIWLVWEKKLDFWINSWYRLSVGRIRIRFSKFRICRIRPKMDRIRNSDNYVLIRLFFFIQAARVEVKGGECPITGQPAAFDPYSEPSNQYYRKQILISKSK